MTLDAKSDLSGQDGSAYLYVKKHGWDHADWTESLGSWYGRRRPKYGRMSL